MDDMNGTEFIPAGKIYEWASGQDHKKKSFEYDYNIGFVFIALAIFGPYIIQYSSMMNAIHNKGLFRQERFDKFHICKRIYLSLAFTWLGLLILPTIDILLKLQCIVDTIFLPFYCCKLKGDKNLNRVVREKTEKMFELVFNLNAFELETFEK